MAPLFPCPSNLPSKESYLRAIEETHTTWGSAILGFLLSFGTVVTTFPLVFKIAKRKSPIGMSGTMLFMANVNQYLTFLNTWVLCFDRFVACEYTAVCIPAFFPPLQYFGLWCCYYVTWILYTRYYKQVLGPDIFFNTMKWSLVVFSVFVGFSVLFFSIYTAYQGACYGTPYFRFIQAISIIAAVVSVIEWIPQIVSTWHLRDSGSFSLLMLSLQLPGACIIVIYDALIAKLDWTSWFGWLITIALEAILITFLILFKAQRRRTPDKYAAHDDRAHVQQQRAFAINSKKPYNEEQLVMEQVSK